MKNGLNNHDIEIKIARTMTVRPVEYKAIQNGVNYFAKKYGVTFKIIDVCENICNKFDPFIDEIQKKSIKESKISNGNFGPQIDLNVFNYELKKHSNGKNFYIVGVDADLKDTNGGKIVGVEESGIIISISRIRHLLPESLISFLIAHNIGHKLLKLVDRDFNVKKNKDKNNYSHCGNEEGICLMSSFNNLDEVIRLSKQVVPRKYWLCPDCGDEVRSNWSFAK